MELCKLATEVVSMICSVRVYPAEATILSLAQVSASASAIRLRLEPDLPKQPVNGQSSHRAILSNHTRRLHC